MHTPNILEPIDKLEFCAVSQDGEVYDPDDPQQYKEYYSTVIGHACQDPEGCASYMEIITGEGYEVDMDVAHYVVEALKNLTKARNEQTDS